MQNPDVEREFILQTDASGYGVGAVLSQEDENGQDHPVAYYSRKLLPRERIYYLTIERECLAIKLGVQAFAVYLLGKSFRIQTDHRALQWLNRSKETNAQLTRWSLALQPYNSQWSTGRARPMEMQMPYPRWSQRGAAHKRRWKRM